MAHNLVQFLRFVLIVLHFQNVKAIRTFYKVPSDIIVDPVHLKLGYVRNWSLIPLLKQTIYNPPSFPPFQKGRGNSRVAICSTGQVRTFTEKHVFGNSKTVFGDGTDIFLVLDPRMKYTWQNISLEKQFSHQDLIGALNEVRPVGLLYYDGIQAVRLLLAENRRMIRKNSDCLGKITFSIQEWTKEICLGMVQAHERKRGWKYDYIVRTRPDVIVIIDALTKAGAKSKKLVDALGASRQFGDPQSIAMTEIHGFNRSSAAISDKFNIIPRKFANEFFTVFSTILSRCPLKEKLRERCARAFKLNDELTCVLGTTLISLPGMKGIVNHRTAIGYKLRSVIARPTSAR